LPCACARQALTRTPGAYVVLAFASICYLLQRRRRTGGQNIALAYTCAMLVVTTAWVGAGARWDEVFLVDGDPSNATCSAPGIVLKVAAMLEFLLSDGLLVRLSVCSFIRAPSV
jgi:hypothetical protein